MVAQIKTRGDISTYTIPLFMANLLGLKMYQIPIIQPAYINEAAKKTAILRKIPLKLSTPKLITVITPDITNLKTASINGFELGKNMYKENNAPTSEPSIILYVLHPFLQISAVSFKMKKLINRLSTISTSRYTIKRHSPRVLFLFNYKLTTIKRMSKKVCM